MRALGTHVDVEEIQTTKSEKLLAVVLAGFLLVGGIWAYQKVDDTIRAAVEREAYRTALDADQPAGTLERAYEDAQARHEQAQTASVSARDDVTGATPAAEAAQERIQAEERRTARLESLGSFGLRLLLVIATLASAYALLGRLRTTGSRYLPLGLAAVGFAAILALVMASDYVSDYVDPLEFGPLVLAAVGSGLTMLAFVALQRYLEKRIPLRRVRKGECPFCGFPSRGESHCEGCGRGVLAECAGCAEPRRGGTLHCGACGSA